MTDLFASVLNMSITASVVILVILVLRIPLKKFSKVFSYLLWLPVLLRLVIPFSFESKLSLLRLLGGNVKAGTGAVELSGWGYMGSRVDLLPARAAAAGTIANNSAATDLTAAAQGSGSLHTAMGIAAVIWLIGMIALLLYSVIVYIKIKRDIKTATFVKENLFETDRISSPFVLGFIKPKIFIPVGIDSSELVYILAHEQTHINRLDYRIKPIAFLVLIVHWFNPLVWLSFVLMGRDMEMSCDESVIKRMGADIRCNYSNSLLSLSVRKNSLIPVGPLAFGESNIKSRIKNILKYKKPALGVSAAAALVTAAAIIVCAANPAGTGKVGELSGSRQIADEPEENYRVYNLKALLEYKTPYVGNNAKVVGLIDTIPLPAGIARDTVELQTDQPPYGITVNLKMKDSSAVTEEGAISGTAFFPHAVLLFCLIDNVDSITYKLTDTTGAYAGTVYSFPYTREYTGKRMREDVRKYSSDEEDLKTLINRINKIQSDQEAGGKIEEYLKAIMEPSAASNPVEYIDAHRTEYESIIKMGDEALDYLLAQLGKSTGNGLKEYIMMYLCKDLLGERNNADDPALSPMAWFSRLSPRQEIRIPDFKGDFKNTAEKLVYQAAVNKYSRPEDGFTVVAPTIYGSYEEKNKLKIFAIVYASQYKLYEKTLSEAGGSIVPAAITFIRLADGSYELEEYKEAMDGTYFSRSIKEFCKMPATKKTIKGLADKILEDCGNNEGRSGLMKKNLVEHLKANGQTGVTLKRSDGQVISLT